MVTGHKIAQLTLYLSVQRVEVTLSDGGRVSALDASHVVIVPLVKLIAGGSVTEIDPSNNPGGLKDLEVAVDRREVVAMIPVAEMDRLRKLLDSDGNLGLLQRRQHPAAAARHPKPLGSEPLFPGSRLGSAVGLHTGQSNTESCCGQTRERRQAGGFQESECAVSEPGRVGPL
jgi:hypothetical protein